MVKYKNYIAGWLDSTVHDFLRGLPSAFPSMHFALVTCLDSNANPASMLESSPELGLLKADCTVTGSGLLMPTSVLLKAESANQIMFGFDEVWFFQTARIEPKPDNASLVGSPNRISQERMDAAGRWMESNQCSFAMGDGCGLNYIVKAEGLLRYVVSHSNEQPSPLGVG